MEGVNVNPHRGMMTISVEEVEHLMTELSPMLNAAVQVSNSVHQPSLSEVFSGFTWITMHFILQPVSIYLKFTIYQLAPPIFLFFFLP